MGSKTVAIKSWLKGTVFGTYLRHSRWNAGIVNVNAIADTVNRNMPPETSAAEKETVIKEILTLAKKYRFSADEYFYYHFRDKSEQVRKTFCSDLNRIDIVEGLNRPQNLAIFNDKMLTYQHYAKYYGRDFCGVKTRKDLPQLLSFVQKHPRFILKPADSSCGQGIQLVDLSDCKALEETLARMVHTYCGSGKDGFVAEELIRQHPQMASLHPSSVNTARITTIRCDDGVEILPSFIRTGRNGKHVDNGGAGGLMAAVDMDTGALIAAADKEGKIYTEHPDTGVQFAGFQIPRWEEAKALARELAQVIPENRYTGWDLALTENGWVMVEGNARGQFIGWQITLQKGFLPELVRILKRLGRKDLLKKFGSQIDIK